MTLLALRPRCRIGLRLPCSTTVALPLVVDVLSGVPMGVWSLCHHACSASASAPHFDVFSPVQIACPERAQPAAWQAFAGWQAAPCAAPPGHRIPVLSGREKMQGKIKGRGTLWREKAVCTWGWRGTRRVAAPCRVVHQCLAGIQQSACYARLTATGLDGGTA